MPAWHDTVNGITLHFCGPDPSWRLVHDGTAVIGEPFYTDGVTGTPHCLSEHATYEACLDEIARLGLSFRPTLDSTSGDV